MKKPIHTIVLSCKKAAELIDKKSAVALSLKEGIQLQIHTTICEGCKTYQQQSKLIDELLVKHLGNQSETKNNQVENKALKEKIISKL